MNFIAAGTFDGVHKGHAQILRELVKSARTGGMESLVLYFTFPPKASISGQTKQTLITLPSEREKLLRSFGIGGVKKLDFNVLGEMSAEKFFTRVMLKKYKMGGILAGQDFAFGKNREGHLDFLRRECARHGIKLKILPFIKCHKHKISSSVIRLLLHEGHVETAAQLLGRPYLISGKVVRGAGLGRKLGFPTANLNVDPRKILPRGVFAVKVRLNKKTYNAVANIGFRPTINPIHKDLPLVEVHLLNFSADIYGQTLAIEFISKIRGEKKFPNLDSLKKNIARDIHRAIASLK
ncbi:MAG: riboflavin biosynthesis protein RibF [Elusimicrobia bacterium]|nr:riboflavin biosynthesis protein RibF [Elusimicrobiota bacterium]